MAFFENAKAITMPIGGAILANIFVIVNSSGEAVASGNGGDAIGVTSEAVTVALYDAGNGQVTVPVIVNQGCKVKVQVTASTAIAVGAAVASDANGTCIPAAIGDAILGYALEAAASDADQEVITVLLTKAARVGV